VKKTADQERKVNYETIKVDEVLEHIDEQLLKKLVRVCYLQSETILDLKNYFNEMNLVSEEMRELAINTLANLIVTPRVQNNISNFVFMHYGFTPEMGATYMGVKRFGEVMAHEMFYSGRNYQGRELKERGVPLKIIPQDEVISTALEVAEDMADKPRLSLTTLKHYLIQPILAQLPQVVKDEVAMHDVTFTTKEVSDRIERMFLQNIVF
jgi:enoyl-CoA hydratase/carnithine racemase